MQRLWRHIHWMPLLMVFTIAGIAGFQYYWLKKAYQRERRTLEMRSNIGFRESVFLLQASRLHLDRLPLDSSLRPLSGAATNPTDTFSERPLRKRIRDDARMMALVQAIHEKEHKGTAMENNAADQLSATDRAGDRERHRRYRQRDRLMQLLYEAESPTDSLTVTDIRNAVHQRLKRQNITVPFQIVRLPAGNNNDEEFNRITVGFRNPVTYQLVLQNTGAYLMQRILAPVVFSVFLLVLVFVTLWVLYRNLLRQQRLGAMKNELISNITHELKTPIATVSVAIEALRNFNAATNPARAQDYLDISASELQRLSLLVDKVLKLSLYEKKEMELRMEPVDLQELAREVIGSMRLQCERLNASMQLYASGDTTLQGDRLNLVSVLYNLLDNALKYSDGNPVIKVTVKGEAQRVDLVIEDEGMGIPPEYRSRIFEKFFRVPQGNRHDAKGYGLGLSYVAHVVARHKGSIRMEANMPRGSRFLISLPKELP